MENVDQIPRQFGLRYLFFITTWIGLGAALAFNPLLIQPVRSFGLGICTYWIAKGIFVASTRLPRVAREVVFLTGLPFYIFSFFSVFLGLLGTVRHCANLLRI